MPDTHLAMEATVTDAEATMALRGELDMATAPDLEERATLLLRRPIHRLTFDMTGVSMVDSVGLAALVRISQRAHACDCTMVLVNVRPIVQRVLDVTGLAAALNVQSQPPAG
jgi:anti-sigma B factor antagonist